MTSTDELRIAVPGAARSNAKDAHRSAKLLPTAADLQLVKIGLLYGGQVELYSLVTPVFVILSGGRAPALSFEEKLEILFDVLPQLTKKCPEYGYLLPLMELRHELERLSTPQHASGKEIIARRAIENRLVAGYDQVAETMRSVSLEGAAAEISTAVQSGLVVPRALGVDARRRDMFFSFLEGVGQSSPAGTMVPLFDGRIGGELLDEQSDGMDGSVAAHPGLRLSGLVARDMVARLPVFPRATIAELLDIRATCEAPLGRFRAAVREIATALRLTRDNSSPEAATHEVVATLSRAANEVSEEVHEDPDLRALDEATADISPDTSAFPRLALGVARRESVEEGVVASAGLNFADASAVMRRYVKRHASRRNREGASVFMATGMAE